MVRAPQVLQRGLPRPLSLAGLPEAPRGAGATSAREAAEALVAREMAALLAHDAAKHPLKEAKKGKVRAAARRCRAAPASSRRVQCSQLWDQL